MTTDHRTGVALVLGTQRLFPPVLLAPMAGYTDAAMRRLCHRCGAALSFTEMTHATALVYNSAKTWDLLETFDDEGPVVAHLFGSDPVVLGDAAGRVAATGRFCAIDLNAGCPVRKVTACGAGAALIRDPERMARIVAAMCVGARLPITVKTRLGMRPDQVAIFEILDAVTRAGAALLTVHGRFASQGHAGPVHFELLAEVKRRATIPVVGNGGIGCAADAAHLRCETGVDGVMVGQAAMGNPWIFAELAAAWDSAAAPGGAGESAAPPRRRPSVDEVRRRLFEHLEGAVELRRRIESRRKDAPHALTPEQAAVVTFRCHCFRYLSGLSGAAHARGRLHTLRTLDDVVRLVDDCLERETARRQA